MTEKEMTNIMLETPHAFSVGDKHFLLYQPTLGKVYINSQIMQQIDINANIMNKNSVVEVLRIVKKQKKELCTLIAYNTFNRKRDIQDVSVVNERAKFFIDKLTDNDIALLFLQLMQFVIASKTQDAISHLKIDEDKTLMQRAQKAKKNNNTYTFGGKSLYGALIGSAMEKYHWTYDYVLWGISYTNLQLLMADAITSIYLTDEERKAACMPSPNAKKVNMTNISKQDLEEIKKRFR